MCTVTARAISTTSPRAVGCAAKALEHSCGSYTLKVLGSKDFTIVPTTPFNKEEQAALAQAVERGEHTGTITGV